MHGSPPGGYAACDYLVQRRRLSLLSSGGPFFELLAPETPALLRSVVTIASVVLLSGLLNHLQQAQGQREFASARSTGTDWIRTVDGWEPSIVLELDPNAATPPTLHPLLVASFQLTASLFALLAFPTVKAVTGKRTARSR